MTQGSERALRNPTLPPEPSGGLIEINEIEVCDTMIAPDLQRRPTLRRARREDRVVDKPRLADVRGDCDHHRPFDPRYGR
jgi:hypothetical protein